MKTWMLVCASLVGSLPACGTKNDKPAETSGSATATDERCTTYAQLTVKCANGVGEPGLIAASCQKTLDRNDDMTPRMKVEVDCVRTTNGDCDAFKKCVASAR